MLIKRKDFMTAETGTVKKSALKLVLATILTAAAFAPNSFASDSVWTDRVISVKFSMAELKTETGLKAVYDKLEKKAVRVCRADRTSLYYRGETTAECVEDLMEQFVQSAQIESLQEYHLSTKSSDA